MLIYVAPGAGVLALLYAFWKASWVSKQDPGNDEMKEIARRIQEGAMAFLAAEYRYLAVFVLIVAGALAAANMSGEGRSWWIAVSFVVGAFASGLAGFIGMRVATNANVRTTNAAKKGLPAALDVAFSGGAVMGMTVVGLALVGLGGLYLLYTMTGVLTPTDAAGNAVAGWLPKLQTTLSVVTGFSMGA
ncbi:MAG: sodium/proton-translocating pyrophosphatase, partial [Myxococcales bacterium]|nr:sodium/proton-translocating pyrophosphatase [Myxococcales bacterium]